MPVESHQLKRGPPQFGTSQRMKAAEVCRTRIRGGRGVTMKDAALLNEKCTRRVAYAAQRARVVITKASSAAPPDTWTAFALPSHLPGASGSTTSGRSCGVWRWAVGGDVQARRPCHAASWSRNDDLAIGRPEPFEDVPRPSPLRRQGRLFAVTHPRRLESQSQVRRARCVAVPRRSATVAQRYDLR